MSLKDKTNLAVTDLGQIDGATCELSPIEEVAPGIRGQQGAQDREQGGLSRAGSSLDRHEIARLDTQVHTSQDMVEPMLTIMKTFLYIY